VTDLDARPAAPFRAPADGRLRADIANAIVHQYKEYYGRGPTMAKAFIEEQYVFVVLEGGFTRNELTLLEAGEQHLVIEYRGRFNEVISPAMRTTMEQLTGRTVLSHHSQVVFEPNRTFEIFVLDAPLDAAPPLH
jgi:uncharacterized protein YbcI